MSSPDEILEKFKIPIEEINLATKNFSLASLIRESKSSKIYKGILSEAWQYRTVAIKRMSVDKEQLSSMIRQELLVALTLNQENIIPFFGYSQKDEKDLILVTEYAENGSLYDYLRGPDRRPTWEERLKICIGAARGLQHLHDGLQDERRVIHRNFKTANILLDKNLNAKICGFDFSMTVDPTEPKVDHAVGTLSYLDPVYYESGIVNTELDVYSFGAVLFEMLAGMLVYNGNNIDDVHPQTLINLDRNDGLDKLIDSSVRINLNMLSFKVFKEIAYKCMSLKLDERPTMKMIAMRLGEALYIQNHGATSTIITRSQPDRQYQESLQIPVAEMTLAMENCSPESLGRHPLHDPISYLELHGGNLLERYQSRPIALKYYKHDDGVFFFHREVEMFHRLNNENIISFIGYCINNDDCFLIQQFPIHGTLLERLSNFRFTWTERLKICIGAAKGLKYLHSGLGEHTRVIHGDVNSEMIWLDDKLEAKINDFRFSVLVDTNEPQVYGAHVGTDFYRDPICNDNGMVTTESDVYSFGVVLFEVLSGKLAQEKMNTYDPLLPQGLIDLVRCYYDDDGGLEKLVDPFIKDHISNDSFQVFKKTAYRCISLNPKDRPTMNMILRRLQEALDIHNNEADFTRSQQLESYLIPLEEIKLATNNFSNDTWSGEGGFGKVYKGKLSQLWKNCTVAIKSLNTEGHQGYKEFNTEVKLISNFRHNNIIPFIGYCNEDNHMIIVTEYASNHSLDHHLQDPKKRSCLTWEHRLKICLGAARGLKYLHLHRVIHRDVKSGNILLDENMEARICDFGLSKENLKNDQQNTQIYTKAAGTHYYLDPYYLETGILRTASDVYSFGVVLFEILSGRMVYSTRSLEDGTSQAPLMNLVRRYHDEDQLEKLVDPSIANQINSRCLHALQEIAYKCISHTPKARPTMDIIVETIEDAMDYQLGLDL